MAKETENQVNKTCAKCVHPCKQKPEYTLVTCRQFKKHSEGPERTSQSSGRSHTSQ